MNFDANANHIIEKKYFKLLENGLLMGNINSGLGNQNADKVIANFKNLFTNEFGNNYDVLITSGASESNSTIINNIPKQSHVIVSTAEHPSITEGIKYLEDNNEISVTWIKPKYNGEICINEIIKTITFDTSTVIIQSVNGETGYIQNIMLLNNYLKNNRPEIHLHIDNTQGYKKINYPPNVGRSISLSLHKIGSIIGIGVLLVEKEINLRPLIFGKQNDGLRGGTYNFAAIMLSLEVIRNYRGKEYGLYKRLFLTQLKYNVLLFPLKNTAINEKLPTMILLSDEGCVGNVISGYIIYKGRIVCSKILANYLLNNNIKIGIGSACNNEKSSDLGSIRSSPLINDNEKTGIFRISFSNDINEQKIKQLTGLLNEFPKLLEKILKGN